MASSDRKDPLPHIRPPARQRDPAIRALPVLPIFIPIDISKDQLRAYCEKIMFTDKSIIDFSGSHFTSSSFEKILKAIEESQSKHCSIVRLNFTGCQFGDDQQDCLHLLGPLLKAMPSIRILGLEGIQTKRIGDLAGCLGNIDEIYFGLAPEDAKGLSSNKGLSTPRVMALPEHRLCRQLPGIAKALQGAEIGVFGLSHCLLDPPGSFILRDCLSGLPLKALLLPSLFIYRRPHRIELGPTGEEVSASLHNSEDTMIVANNLCVVFERVKKTLRFIDLSDIQLMNNYVEHQLFFETMCSTMLKLTQCQVVFNCTAIGKDIEQLLARTCNASNKKLTTLPELDQPRLHTLISAFAMFPNMTMPHPLIRLILSYWPETRFLDHNPGLPVQLTTRDEPPNFVISFSKHQTIEDVKKAAVRIKDAKETIDPRLLFNAFRYWVATTENYLTGPKCIMGEQDQAGGRLVTFFANLNVRLVDDMRELFRLRFQTIKPLQYVTERLTAICGQLDQMIKELEKLKGAENYVDITAALRMARDVMAPFLPAPAVEQTRRLNLPKL